MTLVHSTELAACAQQDRPGDEFSWQRGGSPLSFDGRQGNQKMLEPISAFALALLMCTPALADGMDYAPQRYYPQRFYLPAERHVIEVVQPPWSGNFIINGARFTARTPACYGWVAGERISPGTGTPAARSRCFIISIAAPPAKCGAAVASGRGGGEKGKDSAVAL
jgi:hypothetical protein